MTVEQINTILLDKEKRIQIYKKAYEIHLEMLAYKLTFGMCIEIRNAVAYIYGDKFKVKDLYLPEFEALKPENAKTYWWPNNNLTVRKQMYENHLINIE